MFFNDRSHAGRLLAEALIRYSGTDTVVYSLPRGGVVLGYEVSKFLKCSLDVVITRKIGHPVNPEYAICAVSENSPPICNEYELMTIDKTWLESEISKQRNEIKRRKAAYPCPGISPKGRIAIVVDDGIATGLTLEAALAEIRRQEPKLLIAAVPVSPSDKARKISQTVDAFVCLDITDDYLGAVGMYYLEFPQIDDSQVIELLKLANPALI